MNQHNIQEAYFKLFRDTKTGKVWVYPKDRQRKFARSTNWCTAENDFQSESLELNQNRVVETPGIQALRRLLTPSARLSEPEYRLISQWTALHLIRNPKMRNVFAQDGKDFEREFPDEFEKELLFSESYYKFAHVYVCSGADFFITSDNPVVEVSCSEHFVRFLVLSPQKLVQFSSRNGRLSHEEECMEDFVNAMIWAGAHKYVFSHCGDLDIDKYEKTTNRWGMIPRLEEQKFSIQGYSGKLPSRFPRKG